MLLEENVQFWSEIHQGNHSTLLRHKKQIILLVFLSEIIYLLQYLVTEGGLLAEFTFIKVYRSKNLVWMIIVNVNVRRVKNCRGYFRK